MTVRVTVEDLETGETESMEVPDGDYVITTTGACHVTHTQVYPVKGTHVVTIKQVKGGIRMATPEEIAALPGQEDRE